MRTSLVSAVAVLLPFSLAFTRGAEPEDPSPGSGAAPVVADDPGSREATKINPLLIVGVCPIPTKGRTWSIVWHFNVAEVDPVSAIRVQKFFAAPDVEECLARIIESDATTRDQAALLKPGVTIDQAASAHSAIYDRWRSAEVDQAILEVMSTGARGERCAALLSKCQGLGGPR